MFFLLVTAQPISEKLGRTRKKRGGQKMYKEGFVRRTSLVNGMAFNQGATREHFCHSGSIYNSTLTTPASGKSCFDL